MFHDVNRGCPSHRYRRGEILAAAVVAVVAVVLPVPVPPAGAVGGGPTASIGAQGAADQGEGTHTNKVSNVGPLSPPRDQTLYTSGTSAAPPRNFNPLQPGSSYTGTEGLLYETLFIYDPVRSKFIDWLATGGKWVNPHTYQLHVRPGVDWVSSPAGTVAGKLTGADVAYTVNLAVAGRDGPYSQDLKGALGATAAGRTVTVRFGDDVDYAGWQDYLWHAPVLSKAQWPRAQSGAAGNDNRSPVATGPMVLQAVSRDEACYRANTHWWGWAQLHLSFKFRYLCDVVNQGSGDQLSALVNGRIDWSNALLRGVPSLVGGKVSGYDLKTYYPSAPYMLAADTASLEMNTAKAPMGNVDFRHAVADAIDAHAVVVGAYTGTVAAASPTGLLPNLDEWVDTVAVRQYEARRSLSTAKGLLARSGYRGQPLTIEAPLGWPDLQSAASILAQQLRSGGIHVTVKVVPFARMGADVADGSYDMVIDTSAGLSSSPFNYFRRLYSLPGASGTSTGLNPERFVDQGAWALVQKAARTPVTDVGALRGIYDQLQTDFLKDLPVVPVWYGGAWFQANTTHWENYPSSGSAGDQYTPVMWSGWLGSTTTIFALAALRQP
jgi:peptide/nickel transport system substrate-binding protein